MGLSLEIKEPRGGSGTVTPCKRSRGGAQLGVCETDTTRPRGGRTCCRVVSSATSTRPKPFVRRSPTAEAVGYSATAPTGLALSANSRILHPQTEYLYFYRTSINVFKIICLCLNMAYLPAYFAIWFFNK